MRPHRTVPAHPGQYLALVIGGIYTLIGLLGFLVTGFSGFVRPEGGLLLGFEVNPLHNLVHLIIGLAGIAMWRPLSRAVTYGWLLAIGYGAVFIYGLATADSNEPANFLALNYADNMLHLVTALAGLVVALWIVRRPRTSVEVRG